MSKEVMLLSTEELVEFYDARDQFTGWPDMIIHTEENLAEGLCRLRASRHPEAVYVCSLFPEHLPQPKTAKDFEVVFLAQGEHPWALCYAGLLGVEEDWEAVEPVMTRAANLGNAYAWAWMGIVLPEFVGDRYDTDDMLRFTQRAAQGGDRTGLAFLGDLLIEEDNGCEMDAVAAVAAYKEAARLGYSKGMFSFGKHGFSKTDPDRYLWMGRAARKEHGFWSGFFRDASKHFMQSEPLSVPVMLMMGRLLKGVESISIAGAGYVKHKTEEEIDANMIREVVVMLYGACMTKAQKAVVCWIMCAKRLGLYRDLSTLIGRMVWNMREEFIVLKSQHKSKRIKTV